MRNGPTPLVGRGAECARLGHLVADAAAGTGGAIAVVGDPGAGKTRLVAEAVAAAGDRGVSVRLGRAFDREVERVLGAALDAFGLRLDDLVGPEDATRMVVAAGAGVGAARFLLVDRLVELVEAACAAGPLLLVVEDLHWVDATTMAWLRAVLRRATALPLALVVTARPGADPAAGDLPGIDVLRLHPLDSASVNILARTVLGHVPPSNLRGALNGAAGNPLLVLSVLDAAVHGSVAGPVAGRLAELDPDSLATLQTAAILGTAVAPADVAAVDAASVTDTLARLDAAVGAGFLVPRDDTYAFRHDLHRAAVLDTLPPAARAARHLGTAQMLAARGRAALDVAEHFALGARPGDRDAVVWLRRAARDMVATAPAGALRLVDVALALCVGAPDPDLLLERVRALAGVGRSAEAALLGQSLLREGIDRATEASLRRELAFAAMVDGRAADCVAEIERCEEITNEPGARARLAGEIAFARFLAVDHVGAASAAYRAVNEGRRVGDLTAQVAGDTVRCFLDLFALRVSDAVTRADTVVRLADLPGAAEAYVFQPWFVAALVRLETDDLAGLRTDARRGLVIAGARGAGWAVPGYDAVLAFGALRCGEFDDAVAAVDAVLERVDGADGLGVALWCRAFRAQVQLHRGDMSGAADDLDAAERSVDTSRMQLGHEQVQLARAAWHERCGQPERALAGLVTVWDTFTAIGARSPLPALGVSLARLASQAGERARSAAVAATLVDLAALSGTPSVKCIAELAAAWHEGDPDRALEAAARAARTPRAPLAAHAYGDAALLLRERRRDAEAEGAAREAAIRWSALHAPAEAAACLALTRTARAPAARPRFGIEALTRTERCVVGLLADGLANADIAERLGVSRRTVESHVGSAYRKLEVDSRVALARAALSRGIAAGG